MRTLLMVVAVMALCTVAFAQATVQAEADADVYLTIEEYCVITWDDDFTVVVSNASSGSDSQTFDVSGNFVFNVKAALEMDIGTPGTWSWSCGAAGALERKPMQDIITGAGPGTVNDTSVTVSVANVGFDVPAASWDGTVDKGDMTVRVYKP